MKPCFERVVLIPLLAQLLTHIRQPEAPWQRPEKSIRDESSEIHTGNTGRKSNERSYDRQQPAGEDDYFAAPCKPSVGEIEITARNQNIAAILFNQRTPAVHTNPIGHQRPDHATDGSGHGNSPQIEPAGV